MTRKEGIIPRHQQQYSENENLFNVCITRSTDGSRGIELTWSRLESLSTTSTALLLPTNPQALSIER